MNETSELAALASAFERAARRPLLRVAEAVALTDIPSSRIRRAIQDGELKAGRHVRNGPLLIRSLELARWVLAGEQRG